MLNGSMLRVAALSIAAGFVSAASLQAAPRAIIADECTVTATQAIEVRDGEQQITVTLSEALPATATVEFAEQSSLKASGVAANPEPNSLAIKVDASAAKEGQWDVTLKAGESVCKGKVTVEGAATPL
jgi:hypothetical protein